MLTFSDIALYLSLAGVFGILAKYLRQPLIVGYLLAGVVVANLGLLGESHLLTSFSQIGIALLLFLLGLEMKLGELPSIGKVAVFLGLGQMSLTAIFGFALASLLGFDYLTSLYVGLALAFSSTIVVVKLLSEKKDIASLYGRITVGLLLIQDLVAILTLMFLSGLEAGQLEFANFGLITLKAMFLIVLTWLVSKKVIPYVFDKYISQSTELVFIASVAWALGFSALVSGPMGFTIEIGGFLAGVALSNLPEHLEIAARSRPLRDFFLTLFFIYLGSQLKLDSGFISLIAPALILSAFVLVGKPFIVTVLTGILGYRKRTAFLTGVTTAQISEFSLILVSVGVGLGHLSEESLAILVLVGAITMTISTYLISDSERVYRKLATKLALFERKVTYETVFDNSKKLADHIVLVGCDRTGSSILKKLQKKNLDLVVVDFNPKVVRRLTTEGVNVIFGDVSDPEIMADLEIDKSKMVISTTGSLEDNFKILEYLRNIKGQVKPISVFTADTKYEALGLYNKGASYVVVPDVTTGDYISHLLAVHSPRSIERLGENDLRRLLAKV